MDVLIIALVIVLAVFFIFAPVQVLVRSVFRFLFGRRVGVSSWRALKWSAGLSCATMAIFLDQLWLLVGVGRFVLGPILAIVICVCAWQAYKYLWKDWDKDDKFCPPSFWMANFGVSFIVCITFYIWLKILYGTMLAAF